MLPTLSRRQRGWMEPYAPMERMMDRFLRSWWPEMSAEEEMTGSYPVDIHEEDGKVIVDAEMPGFQRDEIDVDVNKGVLHISAERKPGECKGKKHLTERCYTRVERSFTLPTAVDESKVDAKLQDGVLHLELGQAEESKPRKIEIK